MHESKAYSTVFYVRNKRKKGAITTTTAVVCVYFESAENTPDMGIKIFKKKKFPQSVWKPVSLPDGTIFKYQSKLTCCKCKILLFSRQQTMVY